MRKENNYKSLGDLANYLNETKYFKKQWVSVKEIIKAFEYVKLFELKNDRYEPTDYMKNSGGCFVTKTGRILFTDEMWNCMTKASDTYSRKEWLRWFVGIYNKITTKQKIALIDSYKFLVVLSNGKIVVGISDDSHATLKKQIYKEYGKDNVIRINVLR